MSDRPIDDGVEGLHDVRGQLSGETAELADLIREDMAAVRRLVEDVGGAGRSSRLSADLDAVMTDMLREVTRLDDDLGAVVTSAASELDQLRRPAEPASPAPEARLSIGDPDTPEAADPAVISVSSAAPGDAAVLREPPPNSVVVVDEIAAYHTDELGRVVLVEAVLTTSVPETRRNVRAQQVLRDRLPGDHAGHLIARVLGGIGEAINLTPMEGRSVNLGHYRASENEWRRAVDRGTTVDLRIQLVYEDDTARPARLNVEYQIDGVRRRRSMRNTPADVRPG